MATQDIPRVLMELADRYPWYEFIAKKQSPPYDKYRTNPNFVEDRLEKLNAIQEPQVDCIHNFDWKQGWFNTVVVNKCTKCWTYGKER